MSSRRLRTVLTPPARQDLQDALQYSLVTWGAEQRDRYADALARGFDPLADFPAIDRTRASLPPDIRTYRIEQHIVVYNVRGETVRMLRILDQRLDLLRALRGE